MRRCARAVALASATLAAATLAVAGVAGCGADHDARAGTTTTASATHRTPSRSVLCGRLDTQIVGTVNASAATELSGLVASRTQRGVLWTHNDSGDRARVFAIDPKGRLLADVDVTGADAFDWEDIEAGPHTLYIGDIGDNLAQRASVVVYRVAEPVVAGSGEGDAATPTASQAAGRIELHYPDGPRDAEALLRDPRSGALIIVAKTFGGHPGIYVADKPVPGTTSTLRRSGRVRLGAGDAVTAGDVSADGRTIALRTYGSAYVWTRRAGESVAAALRRKPCRAGAPLFAEGQGEALALAADGRSFYTVPEGVHPAIRRYAPN
jgi:hypothetical protein